MPQKLKPKRSIPPRTTAARNPVANLRQPGDTPARNRWRKRAVPTYDYEEPVEERGGELGPEHCYSPDRHGEELELRQPH